MPAKGRYDGPAEILSDQGQHIGDAWCTYTVRSDPRTGIGDWWGRLSRIEPEGALELGTEHRLRLPRGDEGRIVIQRLRLATGRPTVATFAGAGPPPGAAGQS
jgi:hypothetical protein